MASPGKGTPCDFHPYQSHTWVQLHGVVVDKEYQLECVKDEVQRLSLYEQENTRKDELIRTLRKEIAEYKKCTQNRDIGFASMKEQLSSSESHLQERIKDIQKLQSELESVQDKLKSTTSKYTSARKELSKLSQTNSHHGEEIRELEKQQRRDSDTISRLQQELAGKKSSSLSGQEKVKRLRSENQELQKKVEHLQAEREVMITSEKNLKVEIAKLKNLASGGQLWQAKYDLNEQELLKAKDKEKSMLAELGQMESEFSELHSHILASFAQHQAPSESIFHLVTQFAEDHFKAEKKLTSIEQELEKHEAEKSAVIGDVTLLCESWKEFQVGVKSDAVSAVALLVENIQKAVLEDDNMQELLETMKSSMDTLQCLTEDSHVKLARLENHIRSCYHGQKDNGGEGDAATIVTNMASSLQSSELEISKLKEQLVEMDLEHNASLTGAVTALRQDEQTRLNEAVAKTRAEEEERLQKELKNVREVCILEKQEAVLREQEIAAALREELEALKGAMSSEAEERKALQTELDEAGSKLVTAELSKSQAMSEAEAFKMTLQHQFTEQLSQYKEQTQQYALTIVAMEEKLLNLMESCKSLQTENQTIRTQLDSTTAANSEDTKVRNEKIVKMEELIGVLRNQLGLASVDGSHKETTINQMEDHIRTLNETMEESKAQLQQLHCKEVSDLQLSMARQEAVIECQKTEIENLKEKLHEKTSELADINQQYVKIAEEFEEIQRKMEESNSVDVCQLGHLTLTEAGHMCLGDKHCEIIGNQRTALAQLRERVSELEQAKPPVGSHQATLKELSRVRHELLRLKSNVLRGKPDVAKKEQATLKPQFTLVEASQSHEANLEQIEETLQCSERMYKNLVEVICQGLPGVSRYPLQSEDQLTATDEQAKKKQVLKGRKRFADNVCRQLTRQAKLNAEISSAGEGKAGAASADLDEEASEKKPEEVIADLEAVLAATNEELEQQKKLNQSLLKRKNFKEAQLIVSMQRPRHVCH